MPCRQWRIQPLSPILISRSQGERGISPRTEENSPLLIWCATHAAIAADMITH